MPDALCGAAAWRSRFRSNSTSARLANTQWVVNVYPDGEEHYRGALGAAIGCDKAEIRSKYFADLGRMRQDYVDNRGIPSN